MRMCMVRVWCGALRCSTMRYPTTPHDRMEEDDIGKDCTGCSCYTRVLGSTMPAITHRISQLHCQLLAMNSYTSSWSKACSVSFSLLIGCVVRFPRDRLLMAHLWWCNLHDVDIPSMSSMVSTHVFAVADVCMQGWIVYDIPHVCDAFIVRFVCRRAVPSGPWSSSPSCSCRARSSQCRHTPGV